MEKIKYSFKNKVGGAVTNAQLPDKPIHTKPVIIDFKEPQELLELKLLKLLELSYDMFKYPRHKKNTMINNYIHYAQDARTGVRGDTDNELKQKIVCVFIFLSDLLDIQLVEYNVKKRKVEIINSKKIEGFKTTIEDFYIKDNPQPPIPAVNVKRMIDFFNKSNGSGGKKDDLGLPDVPTHVPVTLSTKFKEFKKFIEFLPSVPTTLPTSTPTSVVKRQLEPVVGLGKKYSKRKSTRTKRKPRSKRKTPKRKAKSKRK